MFGTMTPFPGTLVAKLAAAGEGGYTGLSTDWDDYKMRLGSGLTYANFTKQQLNLLMLEAYVKIYLLNYRFADFIDFVWNYRKGAWQLLKKMMKLRSKIPLNAGEIFGFKLKWKYLRKYNIL